MLLTLPVRLLFIAIVVAACVQLLKHFIPRANGWVAVLINLGVTVYGVAFLLGRENTTIAIILLVALAAAGIHGTATKLSDYPGAKENPTPSGYELEDGDKMEDK